MGGFARRRRFSLLMLAAGALVAFGSPVPALAALSSSITSLTFPALEYSHADQTANGSLTLTATDTGTAGLGMTNSGWNVTLQSSDFAYSGAHGGSPIPAANLSITTAHPPTRISGQEISATGGPRTTNVTGTLDTPRKTLQADGPTGTVLLTYYGIGTYQQVIDVGLLVPGRSRAGTYTATLTVTISAGP